jgi:hypothetical protein
LDSIKQQYETLLLRLSQECELYLVGQVKSDQEEEQIISKITSTKLTGDNPLSIVEAGLNQNKILFCETDRGKIAIARQLEPDVYIDIDEGVVTELARFLPLVALINTSATTTTKSQQKVISPSLLDLFDAIQNKKV